MKRTITLLGFALYTMLSSAQLVEEDFTGGIPASWTQWSGDGITWTSNANFGNTTLGCAIADFGTSSAGANGWLHTPTMDLTSTNSPELNFSVALVGNNFVAPDVSLWYDIGAGWVLIDNWGGTIQANNPIAQTFNLATQLDINNVSWVELNYDLSSFTGASNIRFSFGADFLNGGWVLIDDVLIEDATPGPNNISEHQDKTEFNISPNPSNGLVNISIDEGVDYIEVYNCVGQLETRIEAYDDYSVITQDFSHLTPGVYLVSCIKDGVCLNTNKLILE